MKTLSNILKVNYGDFMDGNQLPKFTDGTIIVAIMDNGKSVPCAPQNYHRITCPMCSSYNGYKVNDPGGYWWACRSNKCIEKNACKSEAYVAPEIDICEIMQHAGVPIRLLDSSFDDWRHSELLKSKMIEYARNPKDSYTFTGNNGVGKSYSSVAILREFYLKHREAPLFYNVSNLYQDWLSQAKSPVALMYKLSNTPLLVLDDLGTRTPTDSFCDFLYLIINSRYADMKGTIVTTNLNPEELVEKFGNSIVSRLCSGNVIEVQGQDMRKNGEL